ncbi:hypothetical protein LCGC14_1196240 [marine sediment metagenome]|uniref:DUF805 domain-containing protein n=1 Tax=marine sediment metagenome TaxID=412755 RepID=A0A0F9PNA0_9ZZZZ
MNTTLDQFTKRYNKHTIRRGGYWIWLIALSTINWLLSEIPSNIHIGVDAFVIVLGIIMYPFATLIVTSARCRDAGLNGWWCLTAFIPIVYIYFGCIRPDDHPKKMRCMEKVDANVDRLRIHNQKKNFK